MRAVVVIFNRHHNKDATFHGMFPWNVRAVLRSLEGRRLLKAILAVNIQGRGCLSASAIRAWWRMIIAVEARHLQESNSTFFTFIGCSPAAACAVLKAALFFFFFPANHYISPPHLTQRHLHNMNSYKSLQSSLSIRKLKAALSRLTYLWKPLLGLSSLVCLTARFACFFFFLEGGGLLLYSFCVIKHKMIHPVYYWQLYCCTVVN